MKIISGHEKGFTLVEMVVSIAILGCIAGVTAMTTSQTLTGSGRSNDQETVLNQVQNAGYWIVRDAQMSENGPGRVQADNNPHTPNVVSYKWWDWSSGSKKLRKIGYTLEDNKLVRTFSRYEGEDEVPPVEKTDVLVATYIDYAESTYDGELLTVTITASVGEAILTKEYEAKPRVSGLENPWEE